MWAQYSLYQYTNEVFSVLWGDYDVQKNPPLILIISQTKTIKSSHPITFKHWPLNYPPKRFPLFRFSTQTLHSLLLYYMHATCHMCYHPCYNYVNNIWWRVTDMKLIAEYSASLYSYLPLTTNILHTTLLSQTLNLCSSLDTRHQISHPHRMTGTMSVLQISTCNILNWTTASIPFSTDQLFHQYLLPAKPEILNIC